MAGREIVGRASELQHIRGALELAAAGAGGVLLLSGEPGIGKTRLVEELATQAATLDMLVVTGRSVDDAGTPALWPWRQIAAAMSEAGRSQLGVILESGSDFDHDDARSRFLYFDRAWQAIGAGAADCAVVLVLEDLHWADVASIALLRHCASHAADAPVLFVGTYRDVADPEPLAPLLSAVARERGVRRLDLGGLDVAATQILTEQLIGIPGNEDLVRSIHEQTGGNPFFLSETLAMLRADGSLVAATSSGTVTIPPSVDDVLGRLLDRLTPHAVRAVGFVALMGGSVSLALLRVLLGHGANEAIDELERDRLIVSAGLGRYELRHAMVGEVARRRLRTVQRAQMHLEIAQAIEKLDATGIRRNAQLAHHYLEATAVEPDTRAIAYAVAAADDARRLHAHEEEGRLCSSALAAVELGVECSPRLRTELWYRVGRSARLSADPERAEEAFAHAIAMAEKDRDDEAFARIAVARSDLDISFDSQTVALLEDALARLAGLGDPLEVSVMCALARQWYFVDLERSQEIAAAAVKLAESCDDSAGLLDALSIHRIALWTPDTMSASVDVAREILRRSVRDGAEFAVEGHHGIAVDALERGDLDTFRDSLAQIDDAARRFRDPLQCAWAAIMRGLLECASGRFANARDSALEALDIASRAALEVPVQIAAAQLIYLDWEEGTIPDPSVDGGPLGELATAWRCGMLSLASVPGNEASVATGVASIVQSRLPQLRRDLTWLVSLTALADAAAFVNDESCAELLTTLEPYSDRVACLGLGVLFGPVALRTGRLRAATGDVAGAKVDLERALEKVEGMGARPWSARVRLTLGELLGPDADGRRLVAQAVAMAEELGMAAVAAEAAIAAERLRGKDRLPAGLTSREAEVLACLARGATNAQIGQELFLSVKTVERHLGNIYVKLGARGRAEAAAFAERHKLV